MLEEAAAADFLPLTLFLQFRFAKICEVGAIGNAILNRRLCQRAALTGNARIFSIGLGLTEGFPFLAFRHCTGSTIACQQWRTVIRVILVGFCLVRRRARVFFRRFNPVGVCVAAGKGCLRLWQIVHASLVHTTSPGRDYTWFAACPLDPTKSLSRDHRPVARLMSCSFHRSGWTRSGQTDHSGSRGE